MIFLAVTAGLVAGAAAGYVAGAVLGFPLAFRRRNAIQNAAFLPRMGPVPAQEGPPTRRCWATAVRRGRCLHERNHLGDHLFPVDLGLPADGH